MKVYTGDGQTIDIGSGSDSASYWSRKRFAVIGDSFSSNAYYSGNHWFRDLCNNLDATAHANMAVSGAGYVANGENTYTAYWQAQQLVVGSYNPDVILIFMGINDVCTKHTIGSIVNTNNIEELDLNTVIGGMQATLIYLQQNFPDAMIVTGFTPGGNYYNNAMGNDPNEYMEAIKLVSKWYNVKYMDTISSGVTYHNDAYSEYWDSTGHPTIACQRRIGQYITMAFTGLGTRKDLLA